MHEGWLARSEGIRKENKRLGGEKWQARSIETHNISREGEKDRDCIVAGKPLFVIMMQHHASLLKFSGRTLGTLSLRTPTYIRAGSEMTKTPPLCSRTILLQLR